LNKNIKKIQITSTLCFALLAFIAQEIVFFKVPNEVSY
jgi:hypothetical protein